jgi:uncharacterized protein YbaR (Trm112 family)
MALYRDALTANNPIDIHFHTFTPPSFIQLIKSVGSMMKATIRWKVTYSKHPYPNGEKAGFIVVIQKLESIQPIQETSETTYKLKKEGSIEMLPVVCPVSLKSLELRSESLVTQDESHRYKIVSGIPDFLVKKRPLPQWW